MNTLTPDGHYYARMGEGHNVPVPYALRLIANWMPPTYEAWGVLYWVSFAIGVLCTAWLGKNAATGFYGGILAVLMWVTLPAIRRSSKWTVLLDMPMWAGAALLAVAYTVSAPLYALLSVVLLVVHERTPIYGAVFCIALFGFDWWHVGVIGWSVLLTLRRLKDYPQPTDQDPAWLKYTYKDFVKRHWVDRRKWQSWFLPLGALWVVPLYCFTWNVALTIAVGFAGLVFAHDRNRIIVSGALPLCVIASWYVPTPVIVAVIIANYFIVWEEP